MTLEDLMPVIVNPDRIAYVVPNKAALDPIVGRLNLSAKAAKTLKANLAQLCGFNEVGSSSDRRVTRDETENWQRLDSVQWCRLRWLDGRTELVPLVGKPGHKLKLAQQHDSRVKSTLKNLLCRNIQELGKDPKWTLLSCAPPAAQHLSDGANLIGLPDPESSPPPPPSWAASLGAQSGSAGQSLSGMAAAPASVLGGMATANVPALGAPSQVRWPIASARTDFEPQVTIALSSLRLNAV